MLGEPRPLPAAGPGRFRHALAVAQERGEIRPTSRGRYVLAGERSAARG